MEGPHGRRIVSPNSRNRRRGNPGPPAGTPNWPGRDYPDPAAGVPGRPSRYHSGPPPEIPNRAGRKQAPHGRPGRRSPPYARLGHRRGSSSFASRFRTSVQRSSTNLTKHERCSGFPPSNCTNGSRTSSEGFRPSSSTSGFRPDHLAPPLVRSLSFSGHSARIGSQIGTAKVPCPRNPAPRS